MVDEQEIVRVAKEKSTAMLAEAEKKTSELRRLASAYVDDMMRKAEECLNDALLTVRQTQNAFKANINDAEE